MNKSLVTESPDMLCNKAEKDILTVKVLSEKKFYPEDRMYDIICFHATQAVEKLLKSFIKSNGKTIEKIHNLDILQKVAMEIDNSFLKIMDDCLLLNDFIPNVKYDDEILITKQHMSLVCYSFQKNYPIRSSKIQLYLRPQESKPISLPDQSSFQ